MPSRLDDLWNSEAPAGAAVAAVEPRPTPNQARQLPAADPWLAREEPGGRGLSQKPKPLYRRALTTYYDTYVSAVGGATRFAREVGRFGAGLTGEVAAVAGESLGGYVPDNRVSAALQDYSDWVAKGIERDKQEGPGYRLEQYAQKRRNAHVSELVRAGRPKEAWVTSLAYQFADAAAYYGLLIAVPVGKAVPGKAAAGVATKWGKVLAITKNSAIRSAIGFALGGGGHTGDARAISSFAYHITPAFSGFIPWTPLAKAVDFGLNTIASDVFVYSKMREELGDDWWKQPAVALNVIVDAFMSAWTRSHFDRTAPHIVREAARQQKVAPAEVAEAMADAKQVMTPKPKTWITMPGVFTNAKDPAMLDLLQAKGVPAKVAAGLAPEDRLALANDARQLDVYLLREGWKDPAFAIKRPAVKGEAVGKPIQAAAKTTPAPEDDEGFADSKVIYTDTEARPAGAPEKAWDEMLEDRRQSGILSRIRRLFGRSQIDDIPEIDRWHADAAESIFRADMDARRLNGAFARMIKANRLSARTSKLAVMLYIDLKNAEERGLGFPKIQLRLWGEYLNKDWHKIFDLSQNLPKDMRELAEEIVTLNRESGQRAVDADLLGEAYDNYVMRLWDRGGKEPRAPKGGFPTSTARTKRRTLDSILHGIASGYRLRIEDPIEAMRFARAEVAQVIANRQLLQIGRNAGFFKDAPPDENWAKLANSQFGQWLPFRMAKKGEVFAKSDIRMDDKGQVWKWHPYYAPKEIAGHLNNALGTSALYDIPLGVGRAIKSVTRAQDIVKQVRLVSAFFHHLAYLRSFYFGGRIGLKDIDPMKAYREGRDAMLNLDAHVVELVRAGWTYARRQEWDENLAREQTLIGGIIDRIPGAKQTKRAILGLHEKHLEFLFGSLGPHLKIKQALYEYRHELKAQGDDIMAGKTSRHKIAKEVARLSNADFGGENLQRMGRNPTLQHVAKLVFLAPDWTESNVKTMARMLLAGREGHMYRAFWLRVLGRGLGATVALGMATSIDDDESIKEKYRRAWKAGNLRWLDWDVTRLYDLLADEPERRKYFRVIGHFGDLPKFVTSPLRSAKNKTNFMIGAMLDALSGEDYAGRRFRNYGELVGLDGDSPGKLVEWDYRRRGPVGWSQMPSWMLYEGKAALPIPVQNFISYMAGEMNGVEAMLNSAGAHVSTGGPNVPSFLGDKKEER